MPSAGIPPAEGASLIRRVTRVADFAVDYRRCAPVRDVEAAPLLVANQIAPKRRRPRLEQIRRQNAIGRFPAEGDLQYVIEFFAEILADVLWLRHRESHFA